MVPLGRANHQQPASPKKLYMRRVLICARRPFSLGFIQMTNLSEIENQKEDDIEPWHRFMMALEEAKEREDANMEGRSRFRADGTIDYDCLHSRGLVYKELRSR